MRERTRRDQKDKGEEERRWEVGRERRKQRSRQRGKEGGGWDRGRQI